MSSDSYQNHRRNSREDQQEYPPLPPANRLPPLRTAWVPRSPSSRAPNPQPQNRFSSQRSYHLSANPRDRYEVASYRRLPHAADVLDELVSLQQIQQAEDRNFQAEFDDVLGRTPEVPSPPPGWAIEGSSSYERGSTHTNIVDTRTRLEDRSAERSHRSGARASIFIDRNGPQQQQRSALARAHLVDEQGYTDRRNQRLPIPPFGYRNIRPIGGNLAEGADTSAPPAERIRSHGLSGLRDGSNSPALPEMPLNMSPPLRPEFPEENRRIKRRKLDSDRLAPSLRPFRYGRYGQVEPGELKMEIVSCDGGLFANESSYAYDNILKNDKSVYCTKSSRCNIVLRHQGATVFSLKELVIKAPGSNYSSPVREGMVFVSMSQDELLTRTAQYQIQYVPTNTRRRFVRNAEGRWVEREPRPLEPIMSIRHHDNGTTSTTRSQARARRLYSLRGEDGDDDEDGNGQQRAHVPLEFTTALSPFNITTECSDEESDEGTARAPTTRRAPNRIGSLPFESESSDEGIPFIPNTYGFDDDEPFATSNRARTDMTLEEAAEAHRAATQEALRAVDVGDLLAPHAKFYIEKDKSKCTIRFDPPVSGRFILLKMWSPHRDAASNIDIQAVIARGYAGPRYFPSIQLR